jgi:hypothetical protein
LQGDGTVTNSKKFRREKKLEKIEKFDIRTIENYDVPKTPAIERTETIPDSILNIDPSVGRGRGCSGLTRVWISRFHPPPVQFWLAMDCSSPGGR